MLLGLRLFRLLPGCYRDNLLLPYAPALPLRQGAWLLAWLVVFLGGVHLIFNSTPDLRSPGWLGSFPALLLFGSIPIAWVAGWDVTQASLQKGSRRVNLPQVLLTGLTREDVLIGLTARALQLQAVMVRICFCSLIGGAITIMRIRSELGIWNYCGTGLYDAHHGSLFLLFVLGVGSWGALFTGAKGAISYTWAALGLEEATPRDTVVRDWMEGMTPLRRQFF